MHWTMTILLVCAFVVTTSDMAECLTSSKEKRNLRAGSVGNTPPVNFCEIFLNGERACGHDSGKILKSRVKRARGTNFKNYFKKNFFEEHKNTVIFLMKTVKKYANYTQKNRHSLRKREVSGLTKTEIRDSLVKQLELRGMNAEFYKDMIDDYVYYWSLKKKLISDIKSKGLRYKTINGNGVVVEKTNDSVVNLQKTTATMLKILADLRLKDPVPEPEKATDGYL